MKTVQVDYGDRGYSIQKAMLDHVKRYPGKGERPEFILWGGKEIRTFDHFVVPPHGTVAFEIRKSKHGATHGFDIKVDGWIELAGGERLQVLRTWADPELEDTGVYTYQSNGRMSVWNVCRRYVEDQKYIDEKWVGNAGFWREVPDEMTRIYHCSGCEDDPPDFESLVFSITIRPM